MVRAWTAAEVLAEAAAWIWVPDDARVVEREDYLLVDFPPGYDDEAPTQVQWTRSSRAPAELVDEVLAQAGVWGRRRCAWWVRDDTAPASLADELTGRGAFLHDTVNVLALPLSRIAPPEVEGVTWRIVRDERTLRDLRTVYREVWGGAEPDEDEWLRQVAEAAQPVGERPAFQVVAYVDGEPASAAGCTRAGDVARLWGAATRPALRGRGAYRAVTHARLAAARDLGATLGLSRARVGTSGPILLRSGFTSYGEERLLALDL